jgi:hypothetical protein
MKEFEDFKILDEIKIKRDVIGTEDDVREIP